MSNEDANSHLHTKIGRSLEQARTERHLHLWRVEEATKIRARYLQDLKREELRRVARRLRLGFPEDLRRLPGT